VTGWEKLGYLIGTFLGAQIKAVDRIGAEWSHKR